MISSHVVVRRYGPERIPFVHLLPSDPSLVKLRKREKLDEVVAPGEGNFERALLLKSWTGSQWEFGSPDPYPPWRAIDILDWIRSGRTKGHCGQFAMVYLQACLSMGLQARYIEIGQRANPYCHFTTEVYLPEYGRWAVLDATPKAHLASYYLRGGIPLSALELHRAYVSGREQEVDVHHDPLFAGEAGERTQGTGVANYYYFRVFLRQDQSLNSPAFRNPDDTADRYSDAIEWSDEETVPWEETREPTKFPLERLTARRTRDPQDLYWSPNLG